MHDPYEIVRMFEADLAEYTGAPCVVVVNSCTMALYLAMLWYRRAGGKFVSIPSHTYPSVKERAIAAGLEVTDSGPWEGVYRLEPSNIWDCAKRLTGGMYKPSQYQCLSFHPQKPLGLSNGGGAILHDNPVADKWFRKMRFDGRREDIPTRDGEYTMIGEHCYMFPDTAAEGIHRLSIYARQYYHPDQPAEIDQYPDMSRWPLK
jgi:dTDP-4-amino-4,6-dideoxygalactose transaminase